MLIRLVRPRPLSPEPAPAGSRASPARAWGGAAALIAGNLAAVAFFLLSYSGRGVSFGPYHIDLDVYRIGARVWLSGGDLYGRLPPTQSGARLLFNYPPAAAILLSPLSLVPLAVAGTALTLASIALVAVVLGVFLRSLPRMPGGTWRQAAWLLPAALFLEPVRTTLLYGQINVVLMALVSLDCLLPTPRWPRGALVGLAAAVKLTPAAFLLFFLLQRNYRAAAVAAVTFLAATAAGFLLAWHDSVAYWSGVIFQAGRIGGAASRGNQCIQAVLARAGLNPHAPAVTAVWLALSALVLVAACWGMRRAFAASQPCLALSLNAFAALLISPVSWSHHWVWGAPAVLTLAAVGHRHGSRLAVAAAAGGLLAFAASPQWWFSYGLGRPAWQQAATSAYVCYATLVLLLAPAVVGPIRRPAPATDPPSAVTAEMS